MKVYSKLDEVSSLLTDIALISKIVIASDLIDVIKINDFIHDIFPSLKDIKYVRIDASIGTIHAIIWEGVLIGISMKKEDRWLHGVEAVERMKNKVSGSIYIYDVKYEALDRRLKNKLLIARNEVLKLKIPEIWIGCQLYGVKIMKTRKIADPRFYGLEGNLNNRAVDILVLRNEYDDGEPLAMGKDIRNEVVPIAVHDTFLRNSPKSYFIALAKMKELSDDLIERIYSYKSGIRKIIGYILPEKSYINSEEYVNSPPLIIYEHRKYVTLKEFLLRKHDFFKLNNAFIPLIGKAAGVLAYAHVMNIVHGCLVPEFILLNERNPNELAIYGFHGGLSKELLLRVDASYIDPLLLLRGKNALPCNDVYSLGWLMYSILTGSNPPITRAVIMDELITQKIGKPNEMLLKMITVSPHTYTSLRNEIRKIIRRDEDPVALCNRIQKILSNKEESFLRILGNNILSHLIKKSISLDLDERYDNAIELLVDLEPHLQKVSQ
jgi:serine/threonine protein kinase